MPVVCWKLLSVDDITMGGAGEVQGDHHLQTAVHIELKNPELTWQHYILPHQRSHY